MPGYDRIFREVLKKIKPSKEQKKKLLALARKTKALADRMAKKKKGKAILAGSITRDTWLPDKKEFDVFILFPEKMSKTELEKTGLKIGKAVIEKLGGKWEIAYAEHPYVSGVVDGFEVDIVPAYEVKSAEKIKSAVDRTPFHVRFIEKHLPLKLSDQVRLLKQFLKAHNLYGADAKTEGFSGFVCELLIIHYRSFLNVLKSAVKWQVGEIIDLQKIYSKNEYANLRKKFAHQVLILIDPTDKNRNTAAALAPKNFFAFKRLAEDFLKRPAVEFFFPAKVEPITEKELVEWQLKRRTEVIVVKFIPPKVVPDMLWPQLRKFGDRLQSILEETKYEFKVLNRGEFTDEKFIAAVVFEMEVGHLPAVQKRIGPSVFDIKDAENFLRKYKDIAIAGPFIENSFWAVETNRSFLTAREKIVDSLSKPLDILIAKGIPKAIAEKIVKGFEVFSETERILEEVKRNPDFGIFLRRFFQKEKLF
jgi:tRNA nucleotidyltransferase (CCA-adding enzyme)